MSSIHFHLVPFVCLLLSLTALASEWDVKILAKVGDKVITSEDLRQQIASQIPVAAQRDKQGWEKAVKQAEQDALESAIVQELAWLDFQSLKAKVPRSYLQERIDRIIQTQAGGSEERFRESLHRQNITYQEFEKRITQQLAAEMLLYDRTRRNLFVADKEIEEFYATHKEEFRQAESYRIQVILLPHAQMASEERQKVAAEVRALLAEGRPFGELAKRFSKGMNAENGGDLGWQENLAPQLKAVVAKLSPGNLASDVLTLNDSDFLVYLADKRGDAGDGLNAETKEKIRSLLLEKHRKERYDAYVRTLYMKYPVRRYVEKEQ